MITPRFADQASPYLGREITTIRVDAKLARRDPAAASRAYTPIYEAIEKIGAGGPSVLVDVGANEGAGLAQWLGLVDLAGDLEEWGVPVLVVVPFVAESEAIRQAGHTAQLLLDRLPSARLVLVENERDGTIAGLHPASDAVATFVRDVAPLKDADRFQLWWEIADAQGHEAERLVEAALHARMPDLEDEAERDQTTADRLRVVPDQLTQSESVFERRQLMAAVASGLVGSGLSVEGAEQAVEALIEDGSVVALGTDAIGEMRYSTPQMIRTEREILAMTQDLSARSMPAPDRDLVKRLVSDNALHSEQVEAVAAFAETGFYDWQHWREANWGTVRAPEWTAILIDEPERLVFRFSTAWSFPHQRSGFWAYSSRI